MIRFAGAPMPSDANMAPALRRLRAVRIGFTMSLFIGSLAFEGQAATYETQLKLGVLGGSLVSAVLGVALLWREPHRAALSG